MNLRTTITVLLPLMLHAHVVHDNDKVKAVGRITFKGSSLRIYNIDGVLTIEPRISFGDVCNAIMYSNLYLKYQLTLPVNIDVNAGQVTVNASHMVRHVEPTELVATANEALARADSQVTVFAELLTEDNERHYRGQLIFLCNTYERCEQLKDDINSQPRRLQMAIKFTLFCRVDDNPVEFGGIRSANLPRIGCPSSQWIVFQRRLDGSLSFAKDWDAYEKGFGSPESNYWMGLRQLSAMTVTCVWTGHNETDTSRCQLRIEMEDFNGSRYWAEYRQFQVLGPEHKYTLRIRDEVPGSQLKYVELFHNEAPFSTFDRDNDEHDGYSCSQMFGHGGWWYRKCFVLNPNGCYTTQSRNENSPAYAVYRRFYDNRYVLMKSTLMMFRCS